MLISFIRNFIRVRAYCPAAFSEFLKPPRLKYIEAVRFT